MDILQTIITVSASLAGAGGITSLFYLRFSKRIKAAEASKADAEAIKVQIGNELTVAKAWENIANERGQELAARADKIDRLYGEITGWRDKCAEQDKKIAELEVKQMTLIYKSCEKRGCQDREPQTGY